MRVRPVVAQSMDAHLAKVDRAQLELGLVLLKDLLATRERLVVAARGGGNLPGQEARGDAHDGVEVARRELLRSGRERQHRRVLGTDVVGEGEALHHVLGGLLHRERVLLRRGLREEDRVAPSDVTGASDIAHDKHVYKRHAGKR